jgi:oxygen-dependent protoporphyrinogen oxidase
MGAFDCDTIVVGGGISGLAAAMALKKAGQTVRLLESRGYLGGAIRTIRDQGYLLELGPNSIQVGDSDPLNDWMSELGVSSHIVPASPVSRNRFIFRENRLLPVPLTLGSFLTTPLLSLRGKVRLLGEWRVPRGMDDYEETVGHFVRRRLGDEVLDTFVDPFVKGVYASDPDMLSLKAAFPVMGELEREYGSLLKGGLASLAKKKKGTSPRGLFSFSAGLSELADACGQYLGDDAGIHADATKWASEEGDGFRVGILYDEDEYYLTSQNLILATSAPQAAELLSPAEKAADRLQEIPYAPIAIAYVGVRREQIAHPLDGFGVLFPTTERRKLLGVIFSSSLFPDRAPEGRVLLTVFAGGMTGQKLAQAFDEDLERIVVGELREVLGLSGTLDFFRIQRWANAIPQYTLGHSDRIREIWQNLPPGLFLAGNYLEGVSVSKAFSSGLSAAKMALRHSAKAR